MRDYDDEQELMRYIWRNYRQIVRPHECVATAERVRDELLPELRDDYWKHAVECQRLVHVCRERGERLSMDINPILPSMRPALLTAVSTAHKKLERQAFWDKFLPHKDKVSIHRCARCQRILVNDKSRQCLWCGYDWH